jgi:predicted amidohydrolase YtcJ
MLIRDAEVDGERCDVRLAEGRIAEVGPALPPFADEVVDAAGGALLPGLQDHHIHLQALAAAMRSVRCGPPEIRDPDDLAGTLRAADPVEGWIRGGAYFESVAGELDRHRLDALRDDVPIRIQHRNGVMWFLNSKALEALAIGPEAPDGVERDERGVPTGRLFRVDAWLRERLPRTGPPDLAPVGSWLAARGVTAVTDCTYSNEASDVAHLAAARRSGALPQRVEAMGTLGLGGRTDALAIGAHKIMLDEPALPDLFALAQRIRAAHEEDRAVAFHAVTRTEVHFALAALEQAGPRPGDRLEHASVATPEAMETIRRLGATVVTQPNFVGERGDDYLRDVEARDRPHLYRVRSWLDADIPLRFGTDAPFGRPDPWAALAAAVDRRTPEGRVLGDEERISAEEALVRFLPDRAASRSTPLRLEPGDPADLCLLDRPWSRARTALAEVGVVRTWVEGALVTAHEDLSSHGLHTSLQSGHRAERSGA